MGSDDNSPENAAGAAVLVASLSQAADGAKVRATSTGKFYRERWDYMVFTVANAAAFARSRRSELPDDVDTGVDRQYAREAVSRSPYCICRKETQIAQDHDGHRCYR